MKTLTTFKISCHKAIDSNVTTKDLRSLLEILRSKYSYLPKDPRTLRHANANKSKNSIRNICDGQYCHFGIQEGILNSLSCIVDLKENDSIQFKSMRMVCLYIRATTDGFGPY